MFGATHKRRHQSREEGFFVLTSLFSKSNDEGWRGVSKNDDVFINGPYTCVGK